MHATSAVGGSGMKIVARGKLDRNLSADGRRQEERRKLVLATTAQQQHHVGPRVDILNISSRGMLLRTLGSLDKHEALTVILPEAGEKVAEIVWSSGDLHGCRFREPLSKGELSAAQLKARTHGSANIARNVDSTDEETFGSRLKRLRMESSYSMVGLAAATGVTKPTLWKWETERVRPRQKALATLAGVLGVSESFLLFGIGEGEDAGADKARGNLAETIASSRKAIAELAGVSSDKVAIDIDFG